MEGTEGSWIRTGIFWGGGSKWRRTERGEDCKEIKTQERPCYCISTTLDFWYTEGVEERAREGRTFLKHNSLIVSSEHSGGPGV